MRHLVCCTIFVDLPRHRIRLGFLNSVALSLKRMPCIWQNELSLHLINRFHFACAASETWIFLSLVSLCGNILVHSLHVIISSSEPRLAFGILGHSLVCSSKKVCSYWWYSHAITNPMRCCILVTVTFIFFKSTPQSR